MSKLSPIANEVLEALEQTSYLAGKDFGEENMKLAQKVDKCLDVKIMLKRDQIVDLGYELADEMAPGNSVTHINVKSMFQEFARRLADKLV